MACRKCSKGGAQVRWLHPQPHPTVSMPTPHLHPMIPRLYTCFIAMHILILVVQCEPTGPELIITSSRSDGATSMTIEGRGETSGTQLEAPKESGGRKGCSANKSSHSEGGGRWNLRHRRGAEAVETPKPGPPAAAPAAFASRSMASSFSRVTDLRAMILGLHMTSLRLPFSEYTSPALGSTSWMATWSCLHNNNVRYGPQSMPREAGGERVRRAGEGWW